MFYSRAPQTAGLFEAPRGDRGQQPRNTSAARVSRAGGARGVPAGWEGLGVSGAAVREALQPLSGDPGRPTPSTRGLRAPGVQNGRSRGRRRRVCAAGVTGVGGRLRNHGPDSVATQAAPRLSARFIRGQRTAKERLPRGGAPAAWTARPAGERRACVAGWAASGGTGEREGRRRGGGEEERRAWRGSRRPAARARALRPPPPGPALTPDGPRPQTPAPARE